MEPGQRYWTVLAPYWDALSIDTPQEFETTIKRVPRPVALLYAAHFCQSEVRNGGFTQFFRNSTGVLAPEAIEGFNAIGQQRVAESVKRAMFFLGAPYSRNRSDRWTALNRLVEQHGGTPATLFGEIKYRNADCFRSIEIEFYSLIDSEAGGFEVAADRYAEHLAI